jgi:Type IV secretory pathway, VirD4 components
MERFLGGISGFILGTLAIMADSVIAIMLLLRMIGVLTKPPHTPYSGTYLLWFIFAIALWVLVAHTSLGAQKYGRVIAGIITAVSIFTGFTGYALTWIGVVGYWPLKNMDLRSFGITSTTVYAQSLMGLFFFIIFVAFSFVLYELTYSSNFWNGFFNWRIDNMTGLNLVKSRAKKLDIVVCIDSATKKPVVIPEQDLTTNIMIQGPTGGGKTSQMLMPILGQVLVHPTAGATVIEPKGSFAKAALQMAKEAGKVYCKFINPEDPETDIFNPLQGDDLDLVASINDAMLSALFGAQDPFFSKNQSVVAKNIILLLKHIHGDDCTYEDVNMLLLDSAECKRKVELLRDSITETDPKFSSRRNLLLWFDKEMFGENKDEVRRFTLGLRVQINELLSNKYMKRCIIGKSTIDMDKLLAEGGFLAVSTHDGLLKDLSKALGMVVLGHLQAAVERRPLPVNKRDVKLQPRPHMIMLDEFGSYVNETFGQFMSKVREYNAPLCLAFQALSQMEEVGRGNNHAFREKVISLCRSKLWFPDVPPEDAKWYSDLSGKAYVEDVSTSTGTSTGKTSWFMPDSYRQAENTRIIEKPNYTYTDILEGMPNTVFYRVMQKRRATKANIGLVDFFDRDFSDPKRIILPKSQFWFDREEFHRQIAKRDAKLGTVRQVVEDDRESSPKKNETTEEAKRAAFQKDTGKEPKQRWDPSHSWEKDEIRSDGFIIPSTFEDELPEDVPSDVNKDKVEDVVDSVSIPEKDNEGWELPVDEIRSPNTQTEKKKITVTDPKTEPDPKPEVKPKTESEPLNVNNTWGKYTADDY